ncbi:hypothetical protein NCCP2222_11600 [Sporosarcina sp. NCCP-2222]|uniref:hypothetical protein n=1 Tax=Sporosarcina sp. NCCP-2222 TaxID=2935073 RepID=UPI002080C46D|nr:hypothetical protein [Sporosarcina sp. NCCP-2222]GKV55213.1 hypothetical protein NCCP2222_11600 [Sporosarcina sp. NCCP-2222]
MGITRQLSVGIAFLLGSFVGFVTFMLQTVVLSDIPVSFTATEALVIQILYFVSTFLLMGGVLLIPSRVGYGVALLLFTAVFLFNIQVFDRRMLHASYDPALLQVQMAPVLHLGLVILFTLFLFVLQWVKKRANDQKRKTKLFVH